MADAFTLHVYKPYHDVAEVFKIVTFDTGLEAAGTPKGSVVNLSAAGKLVARTKATIVAGDILVLRPLPGYGIPIDRYHTTIKTQAATGGNELYGIRLKVGDKLKVHADGTTITVAAA